MTCLFCYPSKYFDFKYLSRCFTLFCILITHRDRRMPKSYTTSLLLLFWDPPGWGLAVWLVSMRCHAHYGGKKKLFGHLDLFTTAYLSPIMDVCRRFGMAKEKFWHKKEITLVLLGCRNNHLPFLTSLVWFLRSVVDQLNQEFCQKCFIEASQDIYSLVCCHFKQLAFWVDCWCRSRVWGSRNRKDDIW